MYAAVIGQQQFIVAPITTPLLSYIQRFEALATKRSVTPKQAIGAEVVCGNAATNWTVACEKNIKES